MTREIDSPELTPLLELFQHDRRDVAVAAVAATVEFPLSDRAWREVGHEAASLLDRVDEPGLREELINAVAVIPVRSVRDRLVAMAASGSNEDRWHAVRALAEARDPSIAPILIRAEHSPTPDPAWALVCLARMPIESSSVTAADLPEPSPDDPDAGFWHTLARARLGAFEPLDLMLSGESELPGFLHGNPWFAYAEIARARPLPAQLQAHLVDQLSASAEPDSDRDRAARLAVWALTGIADAEGSPISVAPEGSSSSAEPVADDAGAHVAPSAAQTDEAREAARWTLENLAAVAGGEPVPEALADLPADEAGAFVHELLRVAQRHAAERPNEPGYLISNPVMNIVTALRPSFEVSAIALCREWTAMDSPVIDADQLAAILERAGVARAIDSVARDPDPGSLGLLARVGRVASGTAGSPFRGSGGEGGDGGRRAIIEDVLAQAPDDLAFAAEGGAETTSGDDTRGGAPPPPLPAPSPPAPGPSPDPRGARKRAPEQPPAATIPAVLSAQGPDEMDVGQESEIRVRVEHEDGAQPLAHSATVAIEPALVSVMLFLSNESVTLRGPVLQEVNAPGPGTASEVTFPIRANATGEARAIVHFQQGSTTLAMLTFTIAVVTEGAATGTAQAQGTASAPDPFDAGVVRILIQQPTTDAPFYTYFVTSELLGFVNKKFTSPPFQGDGSAAERPKTYAQSVYRRIESEVLERAADARVLERRLERIGTDMCVKLFPEALVRDLWQSREHIAAIEVTPVEPYIPWELLRLRHPEEGVDGRHLGEYGLVRVLGGREPARTLGRADWRYVIGDYPNDLYDDLPAERAFLTGDLASLGVTPQAVPANVEDILEAIDPAEFDVIHFACHGEASLDAIDESALIVADRFSAREQKPVPVKVYPADFGTNLTPRRPLVFLSACQSARMGPSLTDFGGWPKVFVEAQAGAMVGTAWAVFEKPAVAFAKAFYDSLLRGDTLGEAAASGRAAARTKGDASWLAYTVYGWSSARMRA